MLGSPKRERGSRPALACASGSLRFRALALLGRVRNGPPLLPFPARSVLISTGARLPRAARPVNIHTRGVRKARSIRSRTREFKELLMVNRMKLGILALGLAVLAVVAAPGSGQ